MFFIFLIKRINTPLSNTKNVKFCLGAGQHLVIEMEGLKMGSLRVRQLLLERRKLEEKQLHGEKIQFYTGKYNRKNANGLVVRSVRSREMSFFC